MTTTMQRVRGLSKNHGFARVGAATFWTIPMGVEENVARHIALAKQADRQRVQLLVFPELGLTGYGCRNAFAETTLQQAALNGLEKFSLETADLDTIFLVGLPLALNGLYNVAAVVHRGFVRALIPKTILASRAEWQEDEWFVPASHLQTTAVKLPWLEYMVPIGTDLRISLIDQRDELIFSMGVEICADGWGSNSPGDQHAYNGATVIANLSASNWILGKNPWRSTLFRGKSGQQKSVYIYSTMSGDSTSSVTWDGHCFILEDGTELATSVRWLKPHQSDLVVSDVDIARLERDRLTDGEWVQAQRLNVHPYRDIEIGTTSYQPDLQDFRRPLTRMPFVPKDPKVMQEVAEELFAGLVQAVVGRLNALSPNAEPIHTYLGLSGGSDSTLVFLIVCRAYDELGWDRSFFHAVRMPGPASSKRTQRNSLLLARAMGTSIQTENITKLATEIVRRAQHEPCWRCLKCENAQARARTNVLYANGFTWGTGDLSEKKSGWSTYGGDQHSMYDVIGNVPKTLVRYLIAAFIEHMTRDKKLKKVLQSILDEIISPELVKVQPGEKIQSSEEKIGPYDLADFFTYQILRTGATPSRVAFLAEMAFSTKERESDLIYDRPTILKWLRDWYMRFISAQFKRNASADSALVGSIGIGAHDKLRLPSDGSCDIWVKEVDRMIASGQSN